MKGKIDLTKIPPTDMCAALDGDYDAANNTCNIPLDDSIKAKSILERDGLVFFFVLQVIGGAIGTVLNTYYMLTTLPTTWWSSYIILAISYAVATAMYWFKTGNWGEAFLRSTISIFVIGLMSVVIGVIYYWDITAFLSAETFAGYPTVSMISGVVISALISVVLLPPSPVGNERRRS